MDGGQMARFRLEEGELTHVLHPKQIVAYRGRPEGRSDRFMDLKGMYRKRKLLRADLAGPCEFLAALPPGYHMKDVRLEGGSDLLFELRHLFYYTGGIRMESKLLRMKMMLASQELWKMKFSGTGHIGILTNGPVYELELHPEEPLFVDARCVVAYPEQARIELCVYGNHLASQHMSYHWKMSGTGQVLVQAGPSNRELEQELNGDGLIKRFFREVLPFGGVFIK